MGNPNPSPATRFGAKNGNPANRGGRTKEQREMDYQSAAMAAKIRHKMLSVMLEKIEGEEDPDASAQAALDFIKTEALKLMKDSEDRAHGEPEQTITATVSPKEAAEAKIEALVARNDERAGVADDTSEE